MKRRDLLRATAGTLLAMGSAGIARRSFASSGQVVVASFGGRFQDAQRKAIFTPFEQATGIKVVEATGISLPKIRTMVQTGNVEWDLFVAVSIDLLQLGNAGMLEPVDYSLMDSKVMAEMPAAAKHRYGTGGIYVSQVVAFNTKAFPAGGPQPKSWADVWDTKKFPGKRMLPAGNYAVNPIEAALLADGVPRDKIYPIDLDRAYAALSRIRPEVVKWVNSSSAVPQALVDGEAVAGLAASARIVELRQQGAPVDMSWQDAIYFVDAWAIPKGAPNYRNALKFMEFASRAEQQAALVREMRYGPTNPRALELLTSAERAEICSAPEVLANSLMIDSDWWAGRDASGKTQLERNFDKWNHWVAS